MSILGYFPCIFRGYPDRLHRKWVSPNIREGYLHQLYHLCIFICDLIYFLMNIVVPFGIKHGKK